MILAVTLHEHFSIFTEDMRPSLCDIARAITWMASLEEMGMSHVNLDSLVKLAVSNLEEEAINEAKAQTEVEIADECWNRNDRLNMIAYEDRK